ncbi:MAG: hypothetical protein R3335_00550 [Anaerolineales bacterium]|nr:hypothetical protein [Anaerolineales bacterium]
MRKFLLISGLISLVLGIAVFWGLFALSAASPFQPGQLLFPVQFFAERQRSNLIAAADEAAQYEMHLLEKRTEDLESLAASSHELAGLQYLDIGLDHISIAIAGASQTTADLLRPRLLAVADNAEAALATFVVVPVEDPQVFEAFLAKISAWRMLLLASEMDQQALTEFSTIRIPIDRRSLRGQPEALDDELSAGIQFQPGSGGAEHAFFPLFGSHAALECSACHLEEQFSGTPTECALCHVDDRPQNHYSENCAACHQPTTWDAAVFDHSAVDTGNCLGCHAGDQPTGHFSGQCSVCHSTAGWPGATFNHAGQTNCTSCHSSDAPANHFSGQCSACHSTNRWGGATFNHAGQTNCKACHTGTAPANHYDGQCSACHNTNGWGGVSFDHTGLTNCTGCHSSNAPANHFSGQCSACHNTNGWGGASFDHTGLTDCVACHTNTAPANHFGGQCSACHNTNGWGGATFDHSGQTNCSGCHAGNAPGNHFPGQCSECHNTNNWNFQHNNGLNCLACHAGDEPDDPDHPNGQQCSNCHGTGDWDLDDSNAAFAITEAVSVLWKEHQPAFPSSPGIQGEQLASCSLCHNSAELTHP